MRSLLVFDGAMGSLLYERGVFVTQNFEQLNVTRPDVVAQDPRGLRRRRRAGASRPTPSAPTASPRPPRPGRPGARATTSPAPGWRARRPARTCGWPARSARPAWSPASRREAELDAGRRDLRRAGRGARRGRRRPARARDLPPPRGDPDRHRGGAQGAPGRPDHRLDGVRRQRARSPTAPTPEQVATHAARLGRRRDRRQLRRRPAARARHRRAHARGGAAAVRAAQRRPAAHRRRPPALHGHARVLRRVRAPHDPARRHDDRRLLRHHARARPLDGEVRRGCSGDKRTSRSVRPSAVAGGRGGAGPRAHAAGRAQRASRRRSRPASSWSRSR